MDKNKIAQQAKKIMDNFVSALDNAAVKADFAVRREKNIRDESILKTNVDFSERMLKYDGRPFFFNELKALLLHHPKQTSP